MLECQLPSLTRGLQCASLPFLEDPWPWPTVTEAWLGVGSQGVTYSWQWPCMVDS